MIKANRGTETASFTERYGEMAVKEFEDVLWETGKLSDVARYFGFTRSHASSLFTRFYGIPFVDYKRKRSQQLNKQKPTKSYQDMVGLKGG